MTAEEKLRILIGRNWMEVLMESTMPKQDSMVHEQECGRARSHKGSIARRGGNENDYLSGMRKTC